MRQDERAHVVKLRPNGQSVEPVEPEAMEGVQI